MPKLPATHSSPADVPAPRPSASEGRGPRKFAKFQAARNASTKDRPKILATLPCLICSSVSPVSRLQALPNSTGEYHRPPTRKLASAAMTIANQLTSGMTPPFVVVAGFCAGRPKQSWKNGKWGQSFDGGGGAGERPRCHRCALSPFAGATHTFAPHHLKTVPVSRKS